MKTTILNVKAEWKDILYASLKLGTELVVGTLPKRDPRVAELRARVQNPSKLDLGADETGKWVASPTDVQKANRKQAEDDREVVRRDLRHWGIQINSSFRKEVNGVVHDLAGAAISLAFDAYEWELVRSIRRLATLTGIQPEWGTRNVDKDGEFYYKDPDGNPTVAALMKPAKEKIAEKRAALEAMKATAATSAPAVVTASDGGDDIDVMIAGLKEAPVSEEQRMLEATIEADYSAFGVVESWLLGERTRQKGGNKPAAKPVDRNADVQATAERLAEQGRGVMKSVPESTATVEAASELVALELKDGVIVPVREDIVDDMSNDADDSAEDGANAALATEQDVEPTLEEERDILYARVDEILKQADALRVAGDRKGARALEDSTVELERAMGVLTPLVEEAQAQAEREAEEVVRAAEARAIEAAAEAEAAVEANIVRELEDAFDALVDAPAPTDDYAKLVALSKSGGDSKDVARAKKLVGKVILDEITKADAVDAAKTVGLIK